MEKMLSHEESVCLEAWKRWGLILEGAKPPQYQVVLLNDDYTPMGFVVRVLVQFFDKSVAAATQAMMTAHQHGKVVCGYYSAEIAETKAMQVNRYAKQQEHPLLCVMEKIE